MKLLYQIVLTIMTSMLLYSCIGNNSNSQALNSELNSSKNQISRFKQEYLAVFGLQKQFENSEINKSIQLTDDHGEKTNLSVLLKDRKVVIFHYSELNCDECVISELKKLTLFIDSGRINSKDVIVLSKYSNVRHMWVFKKTNGFKVKFYNIDGEDLVGGKITSPYYFIADNTFKLNKLFIVSKDLPDATKIYITKFKNSTINR